MAVAITKENFEEVLASTQPLVIDFGAEWCGPCRTIAPIMEELAETYKDRAVVATCDIEENDDLASKYGVRNIPTILFLRGGEVVDKQVGAVSKAALAEKLEKLLQ